MCNNTSRDLADRVMVSGNSQLSNDVSSDSEEFSSDKVGDLQDEQINNSNNSSVSLNNSQNNQSSIDNGLVDSFNSSNTARFLQTMNYLFLNSSLQSSTNNNLDEQPQLNNELLESIQNLLVQGGNQNLATNLLAVAAANQRTNNWFACKFCTFTTSKRQQLIKHVRTNCEGLLSAVANLNSTSSTTNVTNTTTTTSSTTTTNSTDCNSPTTGDQQSNSVSNEDTTSNQLLNPAVMAALSNDQLNSGCGNLVCVNSNCTNGNSCVILPNAGNLLNDKLKSTGQTAEDSEEDFANTANPQDRYCTECEIQFGSYKNYRVSFLNVLFVLV